MLEMFIQGIKQDPYFIDGIILIFLFTLSPLLIGYFYSKKYYNASLKKPDPYSYYLFMHTTIKNQQGMLLWPLGFCVYLIFFKGTDLFVVLPILVFSFFWLAGYLLFFYRYFFFLNLFDQKSLSENKKSVWHNVMKETIFDVALTCFFAIVFVVIIHIKN